LILPLLVFSLFFGVKTVLISFLLIINTEKSMITHHRFSVGAKNHPIQENDIEIVGDDHVEKL